MRYVIIRDDDTNALTPVECLERLYRPFLNRGMPVNLAVIPSVALDTTKPDGELEGYLLKHRSKGILPIGGNQQLISYLRQNPLYHVVQHGCHHEYLEFEKLQNGEVAARIAEGMQALRESGFKKPETFVAPYDKLSRESFIEVARQFRVLSTGWFELKRLPPAWWPSYLLKKARGNCHWHINGTILLSHPGCMLSYFHAPATILPRIRQHIASHSITVLVTHWWEYFRNGKVDEPFIQVLHETADYLANERDLKVISFAELGKGEVALN